MDSILNIRQIPKSKFDRIVTYWLSFLCFASPFIGLGVFFPIGVLFLYRSNHTLRASAFQSAALQIFVYAVSFPLDFICLWDETSPYCIAGLKNERALAFQGYFLLFWGIVGFIILFLEARFSVSKYGYLKSSKYRYSSERSASGDSFLYTFFIVFLSWFSAVFLFVMLTALYLFLSAKDSQMELDNLIALSFKGEGSLLFWLLNVHTVSKMVGRKTVLWVLRRPYLYLYSNTRLGSSSTVPETASWQRKSRYAKFREAVMPGLGQVYLNRYWPGFSTLFVYLLFLLFASTAVIYHLDYVFGTKFLQFFGLKPGIPDKEFIRYADNIFFPIFCTLGLISVYAFAQFLVRHFLKREAEPIEERGLRSGFQDNLALSVLLHLTLLSVMFIIPVTVQRQSSSQKKRDMSKDHFQPEKMEFYFIDPEIPDDVKDLNGGVVSGTETPTETEGMKIPDEEIKDEGKVKGYVKKIKGKKLPKTYSNYISARMRGPEMYMDYWKRAPHPYSCVVAYTITTEGEITDVYIVEPSGYPDQDRLTVELVQSMSPVMPPPGVKGDVRVTELFWNGPIDPDAMPTELQKEMVSMFDGRYMEEEF